MRVHLLFDFARGFDLVATEGTAQAIQAAGIACRPVNKVREGRPHCVDMIKNGEIAMIINTVEEKRAAIQDGPPELPARRVSSSSVTRATPLS